MAAIDNLEIQIQSDSSSAVSSINELASSLAKIKNAVKGGIGLKSVSNQISELDSSLQGIDSGSVSKIDRLAESLSKLSSVKISSSIGTQLKSIGSNLSSLTTEGLYNLNELGTALNPLAGLGKAGGLKSIITQLGKLPELATALNAVNFAQFTSDIQALSNALAPLANRLDITANAFTRLPANIRRTVSATRTIPSANKEAELSYVNLWAKVHLTINVLRRAAGFLASWITKSNQYIEDLNLFNVSMGKYAREAKKYADIVSDAVGIDPGEFMRNQGIFNTIIKGFGVAEDRAYLMSKNLTQLGYDISSFYNIPFENSMEKLQSGISGELEPLRRLGYDLSVARLQQEAYTLGIDRKVSAMTQAEKSELRYYAIMTQVTTAQGDMARTLNAPANQLRVFNAQLTLAARSLGNLFLPVLKLILPYAIAAAKVIRYLAETIAGFFGIKLTDFSASFDSASESMGGLVDNTDKVSDGLGKATKAAKKLKNATLGIDELNIISPDDKDAGGGNAGAGSGAGAEGGLGIKLPEYNFLDDVKKQTDEITEGMKRHLKDVLAVVVAIGAGFAAWKIAKGITTAIKSLKELGNFKLSFAMTGVAMFLSDLDEFIKYFKDFEKNGPTFKNVAGMISQFAGMIGDAFVVLGNIKLGGVLKIVQGIGEIITAAKDIADNGINWDNIRIALRGISNIVIGAGLISGNMALLGGGLAFQGLIGVITEIKNIIQAIKTGDWEVVSWTSLAIGAVESIIGFILIFKEFKTVGDSAKALDDASNSMKGLTTATNTVGETAGGVNTAAKTLTQKLETLVVNMGLIVVVIGEVALAALIIVGSIALLGMELNAVANAWEPIVSENGTGATVLKALGAGTALLVAVGVITYALGKATIKGGGSIAASVAVGTAVLIEIGIAAVAFIKEVEIIGKRLQKIEPAWKPVLDNGKDTATAIGAGTALLVAVGVVTYALGKATIASGGSIALSIAVGTAVLVEIGIATVAFIKEIEIIGKSLQKIGKAWKPVIDNGKDIAIAIGAGTALLVAVGTATAALGAATVASGGTIPLAIGAGTAVLVALGEATVLFVDSLTNVANSLTNDLAPALEDLNSKLPSLNDNTTSFVDYMIKFAGEVVRYTAADAVAGLSATIDKIIGWFTDDPIETLADDVEKIHEQTKGLNQKLNVAVPELKTAKELLSSYRRFLIRIESLTKTNVKLSDGLFVNMKEVGEKIVTGFVEGIQSKSQDFVNTANTMVEGFKSALESNATNSKSAVTNWATNIQIWFTNDAMGGMNSKKWQENAKNIINGFKDGISSNNIDSKESVLNWAGDIIKWFSDKAFGNVNKDTWEQKGKDIINSFKNSIRLNKSDSESTVKGWGTSVINWFNRPDKKTLKSEFTSIGKNVISGFTDGIGDYVLRSQAEESIRNFAKSIIDTAKSELQVHSPSRTFKDIGQFVVEGFNIGLTSKMSKTYSIMDEWIERVGSYEPELSFETQGFNSLRNGSYTNRVLAEHIYEQSSSYNHSSDSMGRTMREFYREYVEPTLKEIANDTKRQADKSEKTVVQIGNRTVTDAVIEQQEANGYSFT